MPRSKAYAIEKSKEQLFIVLSLFSAILLSGLLLFILFENVNSPNREIPTGNVVEYGVSSSCLDSDNGKDYFRYGTLTSTKGYIGIVSDSCVGDSSFAKQLVEYYCDSEGKGYYQTVNCSDLDNSDLCHFGKCLFCNHNGICEDELGELVEGCPADCRM